MSAKAGGADSSEEPIAIPASKGHELAILNRVLRSEIGHQLRSPVRGITILADLLAEMLDKDEIDSEVLHEISRQLCELAIDANDRLTQFATSDEL